MKFLNKIIISRCVAILFIISLFVLFGCATQNSKENDKLANLHLNLAAEYIKAENYPLALKELLIAEELNPNDPFVNANLGLVYFMRERYELAEKYYRKAILIKPDFTDAKNNLGRAYVEIGKYKQAEVLLNEVLQDLTYTGFTKAYANYGILEFKQKKYTNAITYLKKSLERDRENCYTQVFLGRCYLELNDKAFAITQLDKAIPLCLAIDSDEAHFYSAIALYRNNEKDKSKLRFEELLRRFPSGNSAEKAQKMLELVKKDAL